MLLSETSNRPTAKDPVPNPDDPDEAPLETRADTTVGARAEALLGTRVDTTVGTRVDALLGTRADTTVGTRGETLPGLAPLPGPGLTHYCRDPGGHHCRGPGGQRNTVGRDLSIGIRRDPGWSTARDPG